MIIAITLLQISDHRQIQFRRTRLHKAQHSSHFGIEIAVYFPNKRIKKPGFADSFSGNEFTTSTGALIRVFSFGWCTFPVQAVIRIRLNIDNEAKHVFISG